MRDNIDPMIEDLVDPKAVVSAMKWHQERDRELDYGWLFLMSDDTPVVFCPDVEGCGDDCEDCVITMRFVINGVVWSCYYADATEPDAIEVSRLTGTIVKYRPIRGGTWHLFEPVVGDTLEDLLLEGN